LPKNWNKQLCSGDVNGGRDTCNDDGGGAVFIKDIIDSKTKYVIAGMNGYGFGCGRPGLARFLILFVNIRIKFFLSFIVRKE
jgi:hypothetical protein